LHPAFPQGVEGRNENSNEEKVAKALGDNELLVFLSKGVAQFQLVFISRPFEFFLGEHETITSEEIPRYPIPIHDYPIFG